MSGHGSPTQMAEEQRFVIEISITAYKANKVPLNEAELERFYCLLPKLHEELAVSLWKNLRLQLLSVLQKAALICIATNVKDYSEYLDLKERGVADSIIKSFVKAKLGDSLNVCDLILDYSDGSAPNFKSGEISTSQSSDHSAKDITGHADVCGSATFEQTATSSDSAAAPIVQNAQLSQVARCWSMEYFACTRRSTMSWTYAGKCNQYNLGGIKSDKRSWKKLDNKGCSRQSSHLSHGSLPSISDATQSARQEKSSDMAVFEARFWLFIPESLGKVKEVCLELKDSSDKTMMTKNVDRQLVWTARKKILRGSQYRYSLQLKDSLTAKLVKFVTFQKRGSQLEDTEWRPASEHLIQKDILSDECESNDKTAAYNYFLVQMLEDAQTTDQLKQQIEDFNRKHCKLLEHCSGLVELACNLIHHFIRDSKATPMKAAFVVHVLAAFNNHSGFLNNLVRRIDAKTLKVLIKNMKNNTFVLLTKEIDIKSENVIIALVESHVGSKCTFIDLVLYSYPTVSSELILKNRDKYDDTNCVSEERVISATKLLCHFFENTETGCELLFETVCRGKSFTASLHALSDLHTKKPLEQEHDTLKQLRRKVTDFAKRQICSCKSFDQLYKLYVVMDDSYQGLMNEFVCEFEDGILNLFDEQTCTPEQIKQLKLIICNQDFFKCQEHTIRLITMVVNSAKIHSFFPEMLKTYKFAESLKAEPSHCLPELIQIWLDTARQIKDSFAYDHDWYDHILSITESEIIGQNRELLAVSKDMILNYFCEAARKSITYCTDVTKLALDSNLLVEDQNMEKAVFNRLSSDLEQHVIELARTRASLIKKGEQEAFLWIVKSHCMFTERQNSIAILEAVARSEDSNVHGMLVHIMSTGKFWKQLHQEDASNIFQQWIETAKVCHCRRNSKVHNLPNHVLQLYFFLTDVVLLDIPPEYKMLKQELEVYVKRELMGLPIGTRFELLENSIAEKITPCTLTILEKHVNDMEEEIFPKRELEKCLKSYMESGKRFSCVSEKMLLASVDKTLESYKTETEKFKFILSHSHFWFLIICDNHLNNHRTVHLAKSLLNSLTEKVYMSTVTLKEFCDLRTFFTESNQCIELLQVVSGKQRFLEQWKKLTVALERSQAKHEQLKSLCENFLYKMSDVLSIKDIDVIGKELEEARSKLDITSSSSKMGELNKPGFFKHLDDLIKYAEILHQLGRFDGFLILCRHCASELGVSESDAVQSTEDELNCSTLFAVGEEASYELCSLTAVDVAKYFAGECKKQYEDWLRQATSGTSTLGCMLKYGDNEEMINACKHFNIPVSSIVISASKWSNDLESNKQKVTSICGTMEVLGLKVKGTDMGNAIEMFSKCMTYKQTVTIVELSIVMQELQHFLSETDEELWAVFEELSKVTQLVHFLQESLEDDFRNLIDAVEERSEQTLDETTVSDLIKVKEFLQPILRKKAWDTPEELFRTVKKCVEKAGKDISKKINNCFYHWHGLKALYQHVANRGELTRDIIANAMTRGTYVWKLDESNVCTVSLRYKKLKSNDKLCLSSEELNDLRSRALLLSNSEKRKPDKRTSKDRAELQNFVGVVDIINEVSCTVTELRQLGHFSYKIFSCKMQSSKILELPQIVNTLKQELDDWKSVLNSSRQQHLSLNFLHSDQLSLIHNFLLGKCDSEHQVQNVLNFFCPGASIAQLRQFQQTCNKNSSTTQEKLSSIGVALDAVKTETYFRRRNFLNDKKFKNLSQDVSAVVQPGTLYIAHFETESAQTIPILLSLYANTKGYFPVPSEVLFCHKQTSWEEIQLIIHRSVLSAEANEVSELHCICNVELLPGNLQSQLVNALGDLLQNCSSNYSLAVICQGGVHHPIIDHFSSFLHHLQGFDTALLQFCLQTIWPEVTMITSNVPGLGKTEYVRNLASERGCQTKTVHVSGPISRDSLVTRLQKLNIQQGDLLHVNIGEVEDPSFVDACLFQYIVLGCLHSGTKLVCLPTSTVAIEIANTAQDRLKDSLVILSSFKLKNLQWENYDKFLVSSEVRSPVQIVCNYLKSFNDGTLDSRDLVFSGEQRVDALPPETCRELLAQHFSAAADLSFCIIETFLNVLSDQLMKLSNSQFFYVKSLQAMLGKEHPNDVKSKLVKAFLETAKGFASRSVQSCRSMQHFAQAKAFAPSDNQNKLTQEVPQKLDFEDLVKERMKNMVRWADTNHLLVTFNRNDCQTVSALYRDLHEVPKYIKKLFKSQLQKDLPNFEHLSEEQLKVILNRVTGSTLQKIKSGETDVYYAVTPDNLLKMVLVFLRVRANVPVVIMGETGCGKTSLIRYLAQTYGTKFKHFSIHAGTTVEEISKTVFDYVNECLDNRSAELWMFLDEVNTCEHLGLLSEMICHHSYLGKTLPKNLVVLAACNPYRLRKPGKILTAGLEGKVKMDEFSRFVYRVHPLPEAMIDYVWDYGTLHRSDEESYIRQMVINIFPKANKSWSLKEKIANLLIASQDFTRTTEGNDWCVSLRDVYRCQMLMTQFLKMLQSKLEHVIKDSKPNYNKTDLKVHRCAIALALAHCYQSRLADNTTREKYWQLCSKIMFDNEQKYKELVEMVRFEQLDLLRRMELPQGIAMNTALCENVFVILTCILNRIPIFLVGKPGCSKSLSVQLIKSNLRGKDSVDSYFQRLPNLYVVSYQGSESSTSEGIEKVFQKAEKYGENNKQEDVLPVVLLDEIGLAEVSKFNPLKVLHKLLEPATGQLPNVAVVGISNWCLDAAKMNRAIHLSRPDMDVEELFETGKAISHPHSSARSLCSDKTLRALAEAYDKYQRKQRIQNFHGLRDYYALIKYVSRYLSKKQSSFDDKIDEVSVIQKGFQRNFGGLESGPSEISEMFLSSVKKKSGLIWNVEEIITENLGDELARHLMLVTSGDSALGILVRCLEKLERKYVVMFGSKFEEDQTEEYSYRILNRIILCMETGNILILKDLDTIYGSLYDMLNQNYTIVGKKKNCRIALGPHSNPMCHVHDDFRCIVLVDEEKLNLSDPPFLNRFEKQVLRFDDIIDEKQRGLINDLEEWVHDFSHIPEKPVFRKQDAVLGMNVDTISSAVYQITKEQKNWDNSDKFDECRDAILWLVPPDAMLRVSDSELSMKSPTEVKHIQTCYFERPIHQGFSHFFTLLDEKSSDNIPPGFSKTPGIRLVIYTRSNIYVDLHKALEKHKPLQVEKLGNFKSEKQFTTHMRQFFESENRLLILQCEPNENSQHLPLAKFQLEELHREHATKTCKNICIILHVSRIASSANPSSQWQFSFLSGWQLVVIDSLEEQEDFPLTKTLSMTVADLLQTGFRPIKHCIRENLVWAFTCTSSSYRERSMEEFSQLIVQITNSNSLVSCLAECLQKHIRKEHEEPTDYIYITNPTRWQVKVAFDNRLLRSATSFTDALKQYLTECVTIPLANLVHQLEKLSAWHSYFSEETGAIWVGMFSSPHIFSISNVQVPQGPGSFKICHKPLKLQYPFSQIFIEKCLKYEVFFKEELSVEMASSNSYKLSTAMFDRYKELFEEDLKTVIEAENLGSHESKLISDICSYLSMAYSLDEEDRVEIGLWLISFKAPSCDHMQQMNSFTTSLLCLWQHESLFHSLLQLFSECQTLLPCSIKELLTEISSRKQKSESLEEKTCQEKDPGCVDLLHQDDVLVELFSSAEDGTKSEDAVTFLDNQTNPIQEAGENCSTILQEIGMSEEVMSDYSGDTRMATQSQDEIEHVSNIHTYRSETGASHSGHSSEVEGTADVLGSSQKLLALIGLDDEEFLALHPEERLVHLMCRLLIPTKQVLDECHGVSGWHGRVCSVLSFCSSVSSYPVSLHALRIFNDLATVLFHCKLESRIAEQFLMELADGIELENLEKSLDSMQMFAKVMKLMVNLHEENVPAEQIQSFVTLCIGRIMYINPDTELLCAFLEKAATMDLIDKNLSHLQPLLHRVLLEAAGDPSELFKCFEVHIREEGNESVEQYPQIVAIGDALEQVDFKNPVFLVLCIDVIQNVVMEVHAWEQLEHVQSTSDCHLITFEASIKVIAQSQDVSLRLAAAVAYVKEFLHQLKEMIVFDLHENRLTDHNFLYQNIHSLFSSSNPVIAEYILKQLKMDRSFGQVREVLTKVETVIPLPAKVSVPDDDLSLSVGYKLLGRSTERNIDLEKALLNLDKDDKPVHEYLNKDQAQELKILGFFEALLHTAYLPASLRQLTHSEKRIGAWITEQSLQISSNELAFLLQQRLTNEESFSVDLFRLLPGSTHPQLQKSAFLLHLVSVLVAKAQEQHGGCNLFIECLIHPEIILNERVLAKIAESSSNTSAAVNLSLVTCKCWTRVIFLESQCLSCPVCEISWTTAAVQKYRSVEHLDMLTVTETADKEMTGNNILKLMITASLLGSLALDILKPDSTEGSKTLDCKDMLINQFELTWNALEASLQLNAEDLSLFLQNIIDKMDLFPKNYQSFEKDIRGLLKVVVKHFLAPSFYNDIKHYHSCVSTVKEEIKHAVLELPSQHSDKSLKSLRHLFRISKHRTPEDLRAQFYINKKETTHPVLDLFFKKCHSLILLRHTIPLVKWSQLCYQATNHRFTRAECKKLTLSQLRSPDGQEANFEKHYDTFMASWKELWKKENLSILKRFDSSLPDQPQTGAVVICENSESLLYKVLKVLVNIQNMFLEELLAIAQSGKCPSLGFLKKNFTDMAAIKCVLVQNLKENQVIPWNFHSLLETQTKFGQNSSVFGNGNQVCYNFVKIEMEIANSLCLGKAYIVINDTFSFVTYANELFVSCASVLREFRTIIPQKDLAHSVKEGFENKMKTDPEFAKQVMKQTEILLCLVKKTGGSPDQTLTSYVQTWLRNLSSGFQDVLRPFGHEPMRLSHLVALYEFLENIQADVEIETLHEGFKATLPPAAKEELKEFINKSHFSIKLIQAAFRKFVMRYVRNFDPEQMNLNSPLVDWMAEPTFWPEELEMTGAEEKFKTVKSEFPQILNLKHTFHALECIKTMIKEMETKQPKWYKSPLKPDTGSSVASSGEHQRGRHGRRTNAFDAV